MLRPQTRGCGPEQRLRQQGRLLPVALLGLLHARLPLFERLALRGLRRGQEYPQAVGRALYLGAARQLVAADGRLRHRPEVAALLAQGELKEERVFVNDTVLNLLQAQGLRLCRRRAVRACGPYLRVHLAVALGEFVYLFVGGGHLGLRVPVREQLRPALRTLAQLTPQRALALAQLRVGLLTEADAGGRQGLQQRACARTLARLEGRGVVAFGRVKAVQLH